MPAMVVDAPRHRVEQSRRRATPAGKWFLLASLVGTVAGIGAVLFQLLGQLFASEVEGHGTTAAIESFHNNVGRFSILVITLGVFEVVRSQDRIDHLEQPAIALQRGSFNSLYEDLSASSGVDLPSS